MKTLTINPTFRDLIPPLSDEERQMLERAHNAQAAARYRISVNYGAMCLRSLARKLSRSA